MNTIARDKFLKLLAGNNNGSGKGIYSICSTHPVVLEASFRQALKDESIILIESTSNQVDQYGGYTGMKPCDFSAFIKSLAGKTGFPEDMIILGGDHLGPNAWQSMNSEKAMAYAEILVREYVRSGYQKIHLDTSMPCADDPWPLKPELIAQRSLRLCQVAEESWKKYINSDPSLVYVIGTEVPIPGGSTQNEKHLAPTNPGDAAATIDTFRKCFLSAGMSDAWKRTAGIVVQPGVEFGDDHIMNFRENDISELSKVIVENNLVYEVHSTDYQTETNLRNLVENHFCILKVGPWLTYAYREAMFSLESVELEILGKEHPDLSNLTGTIERIMCNDPKYWKKYYHGSEREKYIKRKYSFSDRIRYYWTNHEIENARDRLYRNLRKCRIPLSVISQFMPFQFYEICKGELNSDIDDLVRSHIQQVTGIYSRACGYS